MTLSHTTVVLGATGEKATLSNGALAGSRVRCSFVSFARTKYDTRDWTSHASASSFSYQVINMARSPNASISIVFKFATRAPFESIQIFDNALREFIKARPREWQTFSGFRVKEVVADLGYVGTCRCRIYQAMRLILC